MLIELARNDTTAMKLGSTAQRGHLHGRCSWQHRNCLIHTRGQPSQYSRRSEGVGRVRHQRQLPLEFLSYVYAEPEAYRTLSLCTGTLKLAYLSLSPIKVQYHYWEVDGDEMHNNV